MRSVALIACAGCGFSGPPVPGTAPSLDAAASGDAPATTTWQPLESLTIPTNPKTIVGSTHALAFGVTYRLRASGTIICDTHSSPADAEYFVDFGSQQWLDVYNGTIDVGLAVDDVTVGAVKTPHWGPRTPNHEYEALYAGQGRPLSAVYDDVQYANNIGTLTLQIDAPL